MASDQGSSSEAGPAPRLCHIVKWPDFDGYGFNLHAEKAKTGQFIGKVDENSPAELAGLREGDQIVEVNGVNIANENHRQVVERIKAMVNETKLLVLDEESDKWYKERKLVVKGTQANVIYKKTPATQPKTLLDSSAPKKEETTSDGAKKDTSSKTEEIVVAEAVKETKSKTKKSQKEEERPTQNGHSITEESPTRNGTTETPPPQTISEKKEKPAISPEKVAVVPQPDSVKSSPAKASKSSSVKSSPVKASPLDKVESPKAPKAQNGSASNGASNQHSPLNATTVKATSEPVKTSEDKPTSEKIKSTTDKIKPASEPVNGSSTNNNNTATNAKGGSSDLNLNMSAAQMREMLANKKKHDPRNKTLDMREKYQIVQQM